MISPTERKKIQKMAASTSVRAIEKLIEAEAKRRDLKAKELEEEKKKQKEVREEELKKNSLVLDIEKIKLMKSKDLIIQLRLWKLQIPTLLIYKDLGTNEKKKAKLIELISKK
jgi:hypothetical protein